MKKELDSLLNVNSMVLLPEIGTNGRLYSRVYETNGTYVVSISPKKLLNYTLMYFSSNLEGATAGAQSILGNKNMLPLVICKSLNMYWFPTASPDNPTCMWFSLSHIKKVERITDFRSKVHLVNGVTIEVPMNASRFMMKMDRAATLKMKYEERTRRQALIYYHDKEKLYVAENEEDYRSNIEE